MSRTINLNFLAAHPIITLTSDLGLSDFYVAAVKGAILSKVPNAQIVDITHEIPKHDIMKAAYNLQHSWKHFPEGTVHLISVNATENEQSPHVAVLKDGQYFIGTDSGIFSLIFNSPADEVVQIGHAKENPAIFPLLEVFIEPACQIATGASLKQIGRKIADIRTMLMPAATINDKMLIGSIIYQDSYGNLITNIRKEHFDNMGKNLSFTIVLRSSRHNLNQIHNNYQDVGEADPVALFNHVGFLEIAMNRASASKLLGLKINDPIRIEFDDRKNS